MMTGMRNDVHSTLAITCLTKVLDRLSATLGIHPIVIPVNESHWDLQFVYSVDKRQTSVSARCKNVCCSKYVSARSARTCHDLKDAHMQYSPEPLASVILSM
jgi:hypothetical protein